MLSIRLWAHFIGICAPAVGGLAVSLKKNGWKVTGSDRDIYPPASDYLQKNMITVFDGFAASNIKPTMDLVLLGGGALIMDRTNPELRQAQKLNLQVQSWAKYVGEHVVAKQSVVVAGTFGKTSLTAMLVKIFKDAGVDPSYLIGGFAKDLPDPVRLGTSQYSVVEGDEHPAVLYYDAKSKFDYYKPKYLVLTSAKWDHFNVFPQEDLYLQRFNRLVQNVPKKGLIVACKNGENLDRVLEYARCRIVYYVGNEYQGKLNVLGQYHRQNASGALVLARELGIDQVTISSSLADFRGVKRRLEVRLRTKTVVVIEDFAQHPYKISESVAAVKEVFGGYKVIVVLDPFASILRSNEILPFFAGRFGLAANIFIRKIKVAPSKSKRVTGPDLVTAIGKKAEYVPVDDTLIAKIKHEVGDVPSVVLVCSSGGIEPFIQSLIRKLR